MLGKDLASLDSLAPYPDSTNVTTPKNVFIEGVILAQY